MTDAVWATPPRTPGRALVRRAALLAAAIAVWTLAPLFRLAAIVVAGYAVVGLVRAAVAYRRAANAGGGAADVDGIRVDPVGWTPTREVGNVSAWANEAGDRLVLTSRSDADIPWHDTTALLDYCRREADRIGGGLVDLSVVTVNEVTALRTIVKVQHGMGYRYEASLTIPTAARTFVLRVSAAEGMTGVREPLAHTALLASGDVDLADLIRGSGTANSGPTPIPNWFNDPYDPGCPGRHLATKSDDEVMDQVVPDHALARLRRVLVELHQSVSLRDPEVATPHIEPFQPIRQHRLSAAARGSLLFRTQHYDLAVEAIREAIALDEGAERRDRRAAMRLMLLGFALEQMGRYAEAEDACTRCLALATEIDADPDVTIMAINNLARMRLTLGRPADAEPLFRRALQMAEAHEPQSGNVAIAENGLGLIQAQAGQHVQALGHFARALEIFEAQNAADVRTVLQNQLRSLEALGDRDEAGAVKRRLKALDSKSGETLVADWPPRDDSPG